MPQNELARLDVLVFNKQLARSRTEAQQLICGGNITVDGTVVTKSNFKCPVDCIVTRSSPGPSYVSRGGYKLEAALIYFLIDPAGQICLDVGISTGGFTDCLLQKGALKVVGIDVGHGQLASQLAGDTRVENRESVNARHLSPDLFSERFGIITVDVSFISLNLIVPNLPQLLEADGHILCLIKPQFEVGAGRLGKNGIVHDSKLHSAACEGVYKTAINNGLLLEGTIESPIEGADGNKEFLAHFMRRDNGAEGF